MKEMQKIANNKENKNCKESSRKKLGFFLKEHIISKTKVLCIIGITVTVLMICLFIASDVKIVDETASIEKTSILTALKERIITLALILLAGWVPYFYIPAISYIVYIFMLIGNLLLNMELNGQMVTLVVNFLPIIVDILTVSIITAIGIYMCNYSTKKYKYSQRSSFSFLDVKIQLYQMLKNKDKYEEAIAKKEKKMSDIQKNDVKIDYKNVLKVSAVTIGINLLCCLIQYFLN